MAEPRKEPEARTHDEVDGHALQLYRVEYAGQDEPVYVAATCMSEALDMFDEVFVDRALGLQNVAVATKVEHIPGEVIVR